jgi:hypothetical protein
MPDIRIVDQRCDMDTVRTVTYIINRAKGGSTSPDRNAANAPATLPGSTACSGVNLSRVIEDSLSDLTEALSLLASVTPGTETATPAEPVRRRRRTQSR